MTVTGVSGQIPQSASHVLQSSEASQVPSPHRSGHRPQSFAHDAQVSSAAQTSSPQPMGQAPQSLGHEAQLSSAAQTSSPQPVGHAPQSVAHDAHVSSALQRPSPHEALGLPSMAPPWHEASRNENISAALAATKRRACPRFTEAGLSPTGIKIARSRGGVEPPEPGVIRSENGMQGATRGRTTKPRWDPIGRSTRPPVAGRSRSPTTRAAQSPVRAS